MSYLQRFQDDKDLKNAITPTFLVQEELEVSEDDVSRDRRLALEAQDREFARVLQVHNTIIYRISVLDL